MANHMLGLGSSFPSFSKTAVVSIEKGKEFVEITSEDHKKEGKWLVMFWWPKDFTFVCPTELHAFQAQLGEFEKRGVKVIACSTDTEESHYTWLQMPKEKGGIHGVTYPVIADTSKTITTNYGVLKGSYEYNDDGLLVANGPMIALRGLFLIDKEGIVQHADRKSVV